MSTNIIKKELYSRGPGYNEYTVYVSNYNKSMDTDIIDAVDPNNFGGYVFPLDVASVYNVLRVKIWID